VPLLLTLNSNQPGLRKPVVSFPGWMGARLRIVLNVHVRYRECRAHDKKSFLF